MNGPSVRRRISRRTAGKALLGIGLFGVALSLVATVSGLRLVGDLNTSLGQSEDVARDAIVLVKASLADVETTTRELATVFEDAEVLLDTTADLSETEIAGSVQAVSDALPALIEVAEVVDRTLQALSNVPFGPRYEPAEPFDESLRRVQLELDGLPEDLREQARAIRAAGANLDAVRDGTEAVADDLSRLRDTVDSASGILGPVDTAERRSELAGRLGLARFLTVAVGLTGVVAHLLPVMIGWVLLNPDLLPRLLSPRAAATEE